ncbi:hypothetical protein V1509DRAFT_550330, partial [Lipomyces kononenkoae]
METRGNRLDYLALNDGFDTESQTDSRCSSPILSPMDPGSSSSHYSIGQRESYTEVDPIIQFSDSEILPSESVSQPQSLNSAITGSSASQKCPQESWFWSYFTCTETRSEWIDNRTKKRKFVDRIIQCVVVDDGTGKECTWRTTDSKRQSSSTNMTRHLKEVHSVLPPSAKQVVRPAKATITRFLAKAKENANLTHQQILEKNLIRWVVASCQPFTLIESAEFRKIFNDIPGVSLPFTSRHTRRRRIVDDFELYRAQLKEGL